jgi:hypothetical protein
LPIQVVHTIVCEDKPLVLESLIDVAVALEISSRGTELGCIGALAGQAVRESGTTRKEPGPDGVAIPFHDIVPSLSSVEVGSEGVCAYLVHVAASRTNTVKGTVSADGWVALANTVDFALGVGMQDVFVDGVVIDTFDDVDLKSCQLMSKYIASLCLNTPLP